MVLFLATPSLLLGFLASTGIAGTDMEVLVGVIIMMLLLLWPAVLLFRDLFSLGKWVREYNRNLREQMIKK